jgi:phosphatidylserine/phosphatidylglycerophosphate/cardiolipin synthase-like enzyme
MATFEELKQRYMTVSGGSSLSGGGSSIPVFTGCEVLPMIDGPNYFNDLKSEINRLGTGETAGQFIYIAGWWCAKDFSLDGASAASKLADVLKAKSRAGVDVRVLGWVLAPEVMQSPQVQSNAGISSIVGLNGDTMSFVQRLQAEPSLANKACLNILAHPAGAAHLKMAVVGTSTQAIGFTGGLDLQQGRFSSGWRDVQTRLTGPAAQNFFDAFRAMWNEVRGRSPVTLTAPSSQTPGSPPVTVTSHTSSMPDLPARTIASSSPSRMHVQPARTLPRFNFASLASLSGQLPRNSPLSFAPTGLVEVSTIWEKAIKAAQEYIYIEDQAFYSREVFDWVNTAIKANSELKVVLLTGGADPFDTPNATMVKFLSIAVNNHLLAGLSTAQRDRIGLFHHRSTFIHSKTSIIDDQWAIIGSANSMRRSLYTDFEHSIAFMDENGNAVPNYRATLWGTYFQATIPTVSGGLSRWFSIPFRGSGGTPPLPIIPIDRLRLPLTAATLTADEQALFDEIYDCDSRDPWGDDLMGLVMRQAGTGMLSP